MKALKIIMILVLSTNICQGQDNEANRENEKWWRKESNTDQSAGEIKTLAGKNSHSGAYGAITFKASEFKNNTFVMMGLKGAWIINRSIAIGIEGQGIVPSAKFDNIATSPNEKVFLLGGYGGLFIEPIFFSNQVIHITLPLSSGAGWLGYHRDWEGSHSRTKTNLNDLVDDDIFWYIEPGLGLELNVSKNFRLNFGISKRFTQDMVLKNTSSKAFDKINYNLSFKIGKF